MFDVWCWCWCRTGAHCWRSNERHKRRLVRPENETDFPTETTVKFICLINIIVFIVLDLGCSGQSATWEIIWTAMIFVFHLNLYLYYRYLIEYVNSHDGKPIGPNTPYLCPEVIWKSKIILEIFLFSWMSKKTPRWLLKTKYVICDQIVSNIFFEGSLAIWTFCWWKVHEHISGKTKYCQTNKNAIS